MSDPALQDSERSAPFSIALPDIPALFVNARHAHLLTPDGEMKTCSHEQAQMLVHKKHVLVCHAPFTRARLGLDEFYPYDVLELFAFTHPVKFTVPTPVGLCHALGISAPSDPEDTPLALMEIARVLLSDLQRDPYTKEAPAKAIAEVMGLQGKGWPWAPFVMDALGEKYDPKAPIFGKSTLNVWKHMKEWAEEPPEPPADHMGVTNEEALTRLKHLLARGAHEAEIRPQQSEYAQEMVHAFAPVEDEEKPNIVLAEAGTGVGKTLGYLAPASIWAEKNQGSVWISTYTKNLQRQIDQELDRLYPDPDLKDIHVAVRKGRENYLCLLNFEDLAAGAALAKHPDHAIAAGIMARWAAATKDGDLTGADYPGWLPSLLGYRHTSALADRRGECIYSACDHYHKCFVEKSVRKSKRSRLVVANHALAMIGAALSTPGEDMPSRYVFDEGHHLFSAADSAFAAHLTARETQDLRRWILGAEGGRRSRARGLKRRIEDLLSSDAEAEKLLLGILKGAECLTTDGWSKRLNDSNPSGPCEAFIGKVYKQVFARADGADGPYSLETPVHPVNEDILSGAASLKKALQELQKPMNKLVKHIRDKLADNQGEMEADTRRRLDAVAQGLERRSMMTLSAWIQMLDGLALGTTPADFTDWLEIERIDGRAIDVGYYRHWIDPMKPFSASIKPHLHGMAITSATLRDSAEGDGWDSARKLTGTGYLGDAHEIAMPSPFNYAERTKVFIINDINRNDVRQVAGGYGTLFEAAGGGAMGLFTAISRLRATHEIVAPHLEAAGIPLYAQHIDEIDSGSLVDMFREDTRACLLGTDAMRDGVDVPGESLKLIIFDRVPWPRPTILHKARRDEFGGRIYDEMLTRMKIKQAFGRLVRRADDKGVFVMMDTMFPSRLHNAFPERVEVIKCGIKQAKEQIKEFL